MGDGCALQTIVFKPLGVHRSPDTRIPLVACVTSGLPIAFQLVGDNTNCRLDPSAGIVSAVAVKASCTIAASQPGDARFAPAAPVEQPLVVDFQLVDISWASPLTDFVYTAGGTNLETVQIRARSAAPFAAAITLTPLGGACEVPDSFVLATGKADTTIAFQVHVLLPDSGGASCTLKPGANSTSITTTGGESRTYNIVQTTTAT